jgi:PAS domain S-box-containing protein
MNRSPCVWRSGESLPPMPAGARAISFCLGQREPQSRFSDITMVRTSPRLTPIIRDLILIAIGTLLVALLVTRVHVIDEFIAFYQTSAYPWELEELIIVFLFLVFSFALFAWRRWRELRLEIVQRIRLETELRESQRAMSTLLSNLPGMAYRCRNDRSWTMEFVSAGSSELTGYLPADLVRNRAISYSRIIHALDREMIWDRIQAALREHRPFQIIYRILTAGGQEKWVWEQGRGVYAPSGDVLALEGIVLDITERKRMEDLERIQQEQLAQADKMITLGTLVSGVAHEINNPTNFITLNAPILREAWNGARDVLEDQFRREGDFSVGRFRYSALREKMDLLFDGISEGAKRIKNIVTDLKDFARPDPSDMNQSVDINRVIGSAVSLLQNPIQKRTDRFDLDLSDTVPPIRGSFQKLEQVMINLIQNACEALSDREKAVVVTSALDDTGNLVIVRIMDEGPGIPPEILLRILDPFFTTKRNAGGVGLGLSISARIVKDHGGTLTFESTPGKGTTATVSLPAGQGEVPSKDD